MAPVPLDDLIDAGLAKEKSVEAVFAEIAKNPTVRQHVQDAIDNPPQTHVDGKMIAGPTHTQAIRQAVVDAIGELAKF